MDGEKRGRKKMYAVKKKIDGERDESKLVEAEKQEREKKGYSGGKVYDERVQNRNWNRIKR